MSNDSLRRRLDRLGDPPRENEETPEERRVRVEQRLDEIRARRAASAPLAALMYDEGRSREETPESRERRQELLDELKESVRHQGEG